MIVEIEWTEAGREPRLGVFRGESVVVGPSALCDFRVDREDLGARLVRLRFRAGAFSVESLSDWARVHADGEGEADDAGNRWYPVGCPVHVGPSGECGLRVLRVDVDARPSARELADIGAAGPLQRRPIGADSLDELAWRVAGSDDPRGFLAALDGWVAGVLEREPEEALLLLPRGEDGAWTEYEVWTAGQQHNALGPISLDGESIQPLLAEGRVLARDRGDGGTRIAVPVREGGKLRAVIVFASGFDADSDWARMAPLAGPLVDLAGAVARRHALRRGREGLADENRYFRDRSRRRYLHKDLVSQSVAMRRVHRRIGELVSRDEPVLLTGEPGTGKELLARAIHHLGNRASGMLIPVHCGGLDDDALELELFGFVRGEGDGPGRTGRKGVFELASGGTVFLDEIHMLSLGVQQRLVGLVRDGEVFRAGDAIGRRVSVRVVASTHRDLGELVASGTFLAELADLLATHVIEVPSLRDRREDIGSLVAIFVRTFARRYRKAIRDVSPELLERLHAMSWPGNVRELQTVVERAVLQAADGQEILTSSDLALR